MSELKALEKVRTIARNMAKGRNLENHEECNVLLITANELEAEIAERFMELPVDADGVPIQIGDLLDAPEGEEYGVVEVVELTFDGEDWYFKGEVPLSFMGLAGYFNTAGWRHYHKPRTIEDVLRGMVRLAEDTSNGRLDDGDIEGFANEIRELIGGGE